MTDIDIRPNCDISTYVLNNYTKFIPDKGNIRTIIELGARDCIDTIELEKIYPNATIYSFECNPLQINECKKNLEKATRTVFTEAAITNYSGVKKFYIFKGSNPGASSLYKHKNNQIKETKVKCKTGKWIFDEFNIDVVDVLCMDIQGSEYEALISFEENLKKIKYIIYEDDSSQYKKPDENNISDFLEENNFELVYKDTDFLYKNTLY